MHYLLPLASLFPSLFSFFYPLASKIGCIMGDKRTLSELKYLNTFLKHHMKYQLIIYSYKVEKRRFQRMESFLFKYLLFCDFPDFSYLVP